MSPADLVFDAMNNIANETEIDGFITMGDNLYPVNSTDPTDDEFQTMLKLFKRDKLKDIPIFAIRGNHDCYYQKELLLNLSKKDPQWQMPYYYFSREVEVNDKGEKIGILMVDSCLLLCSNYSYGPVNAPHGTARSAKDELLKHARHEE